MKMIGQEDFNKRKWLEGNIELLENKHQYYTDYAQKNWEPKKLENVAKMKQESEDLKETDLKKKKKIKQTLNNFKKNLINSTIL